jgi:hypothetical protein
MTKENQSMFAPVNDPIHPISEVISIIEIQGFHDLVKKGEISTIQVFFERIAQEIYNTRKKNYSWGFRVIEPEFLNFSNRMYLSSKLYFEEDLSDLNSVIFKLFTEFNNIILSTALHMHIPVKGIIRIVDTYKGTVQSRKPALVTGKEPLILSDLLNVFSFGEIFPHGFTSGMIPAVDMPYHFGEGLSQMEEDLASIESLGVFMPLEYRENMATEVTILSNMMTVTEVNKKMLFTCNWKEWMSAYQACSSDNIMAYAELAAKDPENPFSTYWQSLVEYAVHL